MLNTNYPLISEALLSMPFPTNLLWKEVKAFLLALGIEYAESQDGRIKMGGEGCKAILHRLHYQETVDRGTVIAIRRFLEKQGS